MADKKSTSKLGLFRKKKKQASPSSKKEKKRRLTAEGFKRRQKAENLNPT